MNYRKSNGITKHIDFLLIDIISLLISFSLAYCIKFGDFGFLKSETWLPLIMIIVLVDVVICLFSNPYQHIITRPYYEEILRCLILTFYNLVAVSLLFYILKIGTTFSRQTVLSMFIFYFVLSLIFKCLWKWLIKSGIIRPLNANKSSLMIVAPAVDAGNVISDALAGDSDVFNLKAVCLPEGSDFSVPDGVSAVYGYDCFADYAVDN
ncbi:MAG: hypothetical protein IKY00_06600, partial [Clostridia bacterium]|nr:hypothetical protein [Clostridia bacterium]